MASLIKNQILKHLSKFTKNLSTDKINVSTLRGEGALSNLELNEEVLMDLLELPLWIRLTKAICNRVSCKIQWTKLKSVPIVLHLDEVLVEMETCEELRKQSSQEARPSYSSGTKYGFSDKVIDGMTVTVNNVVINFKSKAFHASVQLSRIVLESRTPNWQKSELYMTRLKEPERGELLIFKQVEWQTLRVEAMAVELEDRFSTPLRLITNQARCCITIKKKLADCSVLGSRLLLILDDLLWVLTDSQLKAALHFANSLSGLIQKATELSQKTKAARKLESLPGYLNQAQLSQQRHQQQQNRPHTSTITKVFSVYDVLETSYHVYSGRIELHLCDEVSSKGYHSQHPQLVDGGAMQITLANLAVDYYPYHLASGDRKHWLRYKENSSARNSWVSVLLADFRQKLNDVIQGESSPRTHPPVHRAPPHMPSQEARRGQPSGSGSHDKKVLNAYLARLMSMCLVLRLEDITIFCVSTTSAKKGSQPPKFLSSDKGRLLLPSDMAAIHLEITEYYYPGDSDIPVPTPNLFCQLNPLQLTIDPATLLWMNAFALNLQKSQALLQPYRPSRKAVMDIRLEALMPRFIFPEDKEHHSQPDRPRQVHAQASRLVVTNIRLGDQCGRMELGKCLETLQQGELFFCSTFPSESTDFYPVIEAFVRQSLNREKKADGDKSEDETDISQRSTKFQEAAEFVKDFKKKFQKDLFWMDNKNIWCIHMDPFWIDFSNTESNKNRPVPFVDAFPLTLWVYQKPDTKLPSKSGSKSVEPSICNGDAFCLPTSTSGDQLAKKTLKDNPLEVESSRDQSRANNNLTDEEETVSKSSVRPGVADLHILAHVQSLVNVQVNHYQYLFLLRSLETMTSFSKLLAEDTSRILDLPLNSSMCFAALFPELDLSLIMPHLPSHPPENEETESLNGGNSVATDVLGTPDQPLFSLRSELGETDISAMHESLSDNQMLKELKSIEDDSRRGSITKSISDSLLENNSTHQESPEASPIVRSQEVLPVGINDYNFTKHTNGSSMASQNSESHSVKSTTILTSQATFIPDKGSLDRMPDNLARTFVSGSNVMKKGFTNLMSSIDSAFSSGKSSVTGPERRITSPEDLQNLEDWETMSIRSDLSSDSDQFLMVHLENQLNPTDETLFPRGEANTKVEVASEVKEDSPSDPSSGSVKRLDLISVVTFRLGRVEFIQQSQGLDSIIRAQCCRLSTEEHGSMTWDEFQTKFSTRSRNWQEAFACLDLSPCSIKFRLTSGPSAEALCPTAGECGYLLGSIHGVSLSLLMSSLSGMMDLIEDEIIQKPMPLRCHFQNIKVHLQEDRPPTNVTSPGPIPIDFYIPEMMTSRSEDGVYHLEFGSLGLGDSVSQFLPHILPTSMKGVHTEMSIQTDSEVGVSEPDGAARLDHPEGVGSWTSTLSGMSPLKTDTQTTEASSVLTPKKHIFNSQESLIEENEQLKLKIQVLSSVERENERLREQLAAEQREAAFSIDRLREAQEELRHLEEEKKSLLATLQLLQNELLASEHRQAIIDQSASG